MTYEWAVIEVTVRAVRGFFIVLPKILTLSQMSIPIILFTERLLSRSFYLVGYKTAKAYLSI